MRSRRTDAPLTGRQAPLGLLQDADVIAVATSGGSDSAAALLHARELAPHATLHACYVDHGVRPRDAIERDIAAVCAQARVASARVLVARLRGARTDAPKDEAFLRRARYIALRAMARRTGARVVVTGHHAGDIAEWVLLALFRGCGLDGLGAMTAMRPLSDGIVLARPFLGQTREQMTAVVERYGVPISTDETNTDVRYSRNLVRAFLARWSARSQGAVRALARSAALASEERAVLDAAAASAANSARIAIDTLDARALRDIPTALLRRIIRAAVRSAAGTIRDFTLAQCEAIAQAIRNRRGGTFKAGRATVLLSAGKLRVKPFAAAGHKGPPNIEADHKRPPNIAADHKGPPYTVTLRAAAVPRTARLSVRLPQSGDTCTPSGRRHAISLARFLAKQGVPRDRRTAVPLLCVNGQIAAAIGVRVMEPYAVHGAEPAVQIAWRPARVPGRPSATDSITMERSE
ncbi:MAG TPA: tRNA lysidine(34) synthetase TilS [Candidatus Eremiobacteraceae bacterium]|nr:tRNA lysidine(34) synthetase TilS [Candidatus Eremiobacteraceae bacterium]